MLTKLPFLKVIGSPYVYDHPSIGYDLFNAPLNTIAEQTLSDNPVYYNDIPRAYGRWYGFDESSLNENLVYDIMHNGRYHFRMKGLKYLSNISDLWFMNSILIGYNSNSSPVLGKEISAVSLQSFANINLAVDALYLGMQAVLPIGKNINEGLFESTEPGIRIVSFVDRLDVVDRTIGQKRVKNLRFHFTLRAYLIDPSLGGQYKDFTATSLLSEKQFYYEQTIPTYSRKDFAAKTSLKTGWGHFIYPATTDDFTAITYVQLSDVLKAVYNSTVFCQSTDNASLKIDSTPLLAWLNTDITLRNASEPYQPSSVVPNQQNVPPTPFVDSNVLKDWFVNVSTASAVRGRPNLDFILSYDNIYWEPLQDVFAQDIYSDSPSTFMSRLTTYYEAPGQSPLDQPGIFEKVGGFVKARRKYFLSNLIQYVASRSNVQKSNVSAYLETSNPERFLGPKFFPYYQFRQYKDEPSGKELLDLVTSSFSSPDVINNIIECETSLNLKKIVPDSVNQYRRKIITKPEFLPGSLGSSTTDRINAIGFVEYVNNDGSTESIQLNLNAGVANLNVFSFLTWIYLSPSLIGDSAQWTRNGRYFTRAKDLRSDNWLSFSQNPWTREGLCTIMQSGMYDTPETAYVEYKQVVNKIYIDTPPSPKDPAWADYYKCLPSSETVEETLEYCDPSPSPDGRRILKRIKRQRFITSVTGVSTPIGDPTYEYPTTTIVLKNESQVLNGKQTLGERTIVYKDCGEFSNTFIPYPTTPTGPTVKTGPDGVKKREIDLSLEDFINPAVFKINELVLSPSDFPIPVSLEKSYYRITFNPNDVGASSSDYTIRLFPGKKGQVTILDVNTLGRPYKGLRLINQDVLANNKASQRVYISTDVWGDGSGSPVKSLLFLFYDGNDWIEFLRRDIY